MGWMYDLPVDKKQKEDKKMSLTTLLNIKYPIIQGGMANMLEDLESLVQVVGMPHA